SRRRHTRWPRDWSSDVCSSDLFDGQATSEVGLRAGLRRDLWTAIEPDIGPLQRFISEADRRFADAGPGVEGVLVAAIMQRYVERSEERRVGKEGRWREAA